MRRNWNPQALIGGSSKMFLESFHFREMQNSTSFKFHFLRNSPIVQIHTSASDCKCVGNAPGSHFVKAFSALPSHSELCQQHHKSAAPLMLISVEETGKNQQQPAQQNMEDAIVLLHCSLLRNPWPKLTGALEHCCEWETKCWSSIFSGRFLLPASIRRRRMSMSISLPTVSIPVNYTGEFRELFEAITYILTRVIRSSFSRITRIVPPWKGFTGRSDVIQSLQLPTIIAKYTGIVNLRYSRWRSQFVCSLTPPPNAEELICHPHRCENLKTLKTYMGGQLT